MIKPRYSKCDIPEDEKATDMVGLEFIDSLYGYAMVLSCNPSDADNLVMGTYARAFEDRHRLRGVSDAKIWLFTILRNMWFGEFKSRKNTNITSNVDDIEIEHKSTSNESIIPLEIRETNEDVVAIRVAINKLPLERREILLLSEFCEFSYEMLAQMLNCHRETVASRLANARSALQKLIAEPKYASPFR